MFVFQPKLKKQIWTVGYTEEIILKKIVPKIKAQSGSVEQSIFM